MERVPRRRRQIGRTCLYKGYETFSSDDGTSPYRWLSPSDPLFPTSIQIEMAVAPERAIFSRPSAGEWTISLETWIPDFQRYPSAAPSPIHLPAICPSCCASSSPNPLTKSTDDPLGWMTRSTWPFAFHRFYTFSLLFSFAFSPLDSRYYLIGLNPGRVLSALWCVPSCVYIELQGPHPTPSSGRLNWMTEYNQLPTS